MKTLFIGNSHTFYNDMPQTFAKLYATGQHTQMETVMLAHPSVDLEWHVKEFFDIRYNLLYGNNDFCIIQQAAHPFPGTNTTIENVMNINELCQEAGTHLYVTLTWAKKSSPQDQEPDESYIRRTEWRYQYYRFACRKDLDGSEQKISGY